MNSNTYGNYEWLGLTHIPEDEQERQDFIDNLVTIKTDSSGTIIAITVD